MKVLRSSLGFSMLGFALVAISLPGCGDGDAARGADGVDGAEGPADPSGKNGKNGTDGLSSLIRTNDEEPGENCPNGGSRVDFGVDTNTSGELDDEEVLGTSYVCVPATPGGPLVVTTPVDPGEECPWAASASTRASTRT